MAEPLRRFLATEAGGAGVMLPRLTPKQLATFGRFGERQPAAAGEPLFGAGGPKAAFVVVLSGLVAMVRGLR